MGRFLLKKDNKASGFIVNGMDMKSKCLGLIIDLLDDKEQFTHLPVPSFPYLQNGNGKQMLRSF